ncbi:MAG: hypothetical protein ACOCRX_12400 [Candidatus Woesearchaeota archaeon]
MSLKTKKILNTINIILGLMLLFSTGFFRIIGGVVIIMGLYNIFSKKNAEEKQRYKDVNENKEIEQNKNDRFNENIKVVEDYKEVKEDEIYRFKNDKSNLLRFKKTIPDDFTRWNNIGLTGEKIAGTSYRQDACKRFINGKNRDVKVNYSPSEKYPEAIEVLGTWEDNKGQHEEQLGFIESEISQEIYNTYDNLPIKANLATIYKPTKDKNLGIRIFLLRKKRPLKFKK